MDQPNERRDAYAHEPPQDRGEEEAVALPKQYSRRSFLRLAALSALGAMSAQAGLPGIAAAFDPKNLVLPPGLTPSYISHLRRRNDLLDLRFEFYNLKRVATGGGSSQLERINPNQAAFMVVYFPPQATAERAFDINENPFAPLGPGQWAKAGETRLAFQIPDEVESIPYTTPALLNWTGLIPRLVPAALDRKSVV